jgi:hypothetical protein
MLDHAPHRACVGGSHCWKPFFTLFPIVAIGNMLRNTLGTHWEIKGIDGNTVGFFCKLGENTKTIRKTLDLNLTIFAKTLEPANTTCYPTIFSLKKPFFCNLIEFSLIKTIAP